MAFAASQLVKKVFLTSWWTGEQAIHNSQWSFRCARKLTCGTPCFIGVFVPACASLARYSGAAHCALLRVLATSALRASDVRKLTRGAPCFTGLIDGYCTLNSQWSSCCALRLAVLPCSLGLLRPVSATGGGLRAPPYQFPLKSYGFSGAETARKQFLLWKMGFSSAAYCESMHPSIQHGRSTALASSLAELPASLGSSYRPALRWPGIPGLRSASRCPRPFTPSGLRGNGLFRALRAAFVRPRRTRRRGRLKRERASFHNSFFPSRLRYAYWYFVSSAWYSGHFS